MRRIKLITNFFRVKAIVALLGKHVVVFVTEKSPTIYEVEVADSRNRVKLITLTVKKVTDIRYRVLSHLSS